MSYKDLTSVAPYGDDFNPDLNFLRIVFTPGRAVQARELTQMQTILQNQVSLFANHFFKNNSTILGAKISTNPNKPGLIAHDFTLADRELGTLSGTPITSTYAIENFVGKTYVNQDPLNLSAPPPTKSITVTHAFEGPGVNELTLYYTFSGAKTVVDDLFYDKAGSSGVAFKAKTAQFLGLAAVSEPGIIYRNGFFVGVMNQEIIIDPGYPTGANHYSIGFRFDEDVLTETDQFHGNLLLDNAAGFYNYVAPGAHRFRVNPVLDYYDIADEGSLSASFSEKFSSYIEIKENRLIRDQRDTEYSKILDLLARRTFDESGNYTVKSFDLVMRDDLLDDDKLIAEVSPGTAYVLGYEINKIVTEKVSIDKAREFELVNNNFALASNHFYFVIDLDEDSGNPSAPAIWGDINLSRGTLIEAHNVERGTTATSGTLVGSARIHSVVKVSDQMRVYLIDCSGSLIQNAGSVKTLRLSTDYTSNGRMVVIDTHSETSGRTPLGSSAFGGSNDQCLIYPLSGATVTKSVADANFDFTVVKEGTLSAGTSLGEGGATVYTVTFTADINDQTFYGSSESGGSLFCMQENNGGTWTTFAPSDINAVTTTVGPLATATVEVLNTKTGASRPVRAYLRTKQTVAPARQKVLTNYTETVICSNPSTVGKILLTKEDCYSLVSITQTSNIKAGLDVPYPLTASDMAKLKFDNGQRKHLYDVGQITGLEKLTSYNSTSGSTSFEVTYQYFEHAGDAFAGYFSVGSYPFTADELELIPTFNPGNGQKFDLVNYVDFRVKKSESVGRAVVLPSNRVTLDTEFYYGRIDKLCVDSTGKFFVAPGISSFTPEVPAEIDNAMTLFIVKLNPYTYDRKSIKLKKVENKRYTMRDIGKLEKRIENLEIYTALSQLENSVNNLSIVDATTGFDKFKNGIFTDPFRNHSFADKESVEYRVAIDPLVGGIRCPFISNSFELSPLSGSNTVTIWDSIATLTPLGVEIMAKNEYASTGINVNPYLFFVWNGTVNLSPAIDTWFETTFAPEIQNEEGSWDAPDTDYGTIWNDWQLNWVGTSYTTLFNPQIRPDGTISSVTSNTTYTNTSASETRTGTSISWVPTSSTSVQDRLINTSQIPYMRTVRVTVNAKGLRQGMPIKGYLDGILMTLIPANTTFSEVSPIGPPYFPKSDSVGNFQGYFIVPARTITTGTKSFYLVDEDDTSSATTTFTSTGILNTRQRTITTVRGVDAVRTVVSDTRGLDSPVTVENRTSSTIWFDPIAQSFLVDSVGGAFLKSIEVFFKQKPTTVGDADYLPITLYIVEMENGSPTQRIVPFSIVTKLPSEVTADDVTPGLGATEFIFSDPVYLEEGSEYAFVLFSNSRKYIAWISTLGEIDIFNYTPGQPAGIPRNISITSQATRATYRQQKFLTSDGQVTIASDITPESFLPRIDPVTAFRGSNTPGRGIAEQPYLGSLFKSQNATTWTPDQMSDITFRVKKYVFPLNTTQILTLRDSKLDTLGESIYPVTGVNFKVSTSMLNIGDLALPGTSISYAYAFHAGISASTYFPVANRENVSLDNEYVLDGNSNTAIRNNFTSRITFKTSNGNVSPVIDLEQTRLVGTYYLLEETDISKSPVITLVTEPNGYPVASTGYDAGTYVSKNISLLNESDDLRVLIDAAIPTGSGIRVMYRTTESQRSYIIPTGATVVGTDLISQTCRLLYRFGTAGADQYKVGDPDNSAPTTVLPNFASTDQRLAISGYETGKVFFRSPTNSARIIAPTGAIDKVFVVAESVALDLIALGSVDIGGTKISDWVTGTDYGNGSNPFYVLYEGRLWRVNSSLYPDGLTAAGAQAFSPSAGGQTWIDTPYVDVDSGPTLEGSNDGWRVMELDEEINSGLDTANQFVEYTYIPSDDPEDFTNFAIKVEMYSAQKNKVPVCRNLRAIAVI